MIYFVDNNSERFLHKCRRVSLACCKSIRSGIGHGEIHFRRLGGAEVAIRAGILHFVEGIAEHLIMRFLAVEEKIDGLSDLFILDLTVKVLINHLGSLLGRDIGEQVRAQIACDGDVISRP